MKSDFNGKRFLRAKGEGAYVFTCHLTMHVGISKPQHQDGPKRQAGISWSRMPLCLCNNPSYHLPHAQPHNLMGTPEGCNPAGLQTAPALRHSPCVTLMADWGEMLDMSSDMGTDQIQAGETGISKTSRNESGV